MAVAGVLVEGAQSFDWIEAVGVAGFITIAVLLNGRADISVEPIISRSIGTYR